REGARGNVGARVAIAGRPGGAGPGLTPQAATAAPAAPAPPPPPGPAPAKPPAAAPAKPAPAASSKAAPAPVAGRILASPIAKTLAAEHGIDLRRVKGSGPGGRIVERDVQAMLQDGARAEPAPDEDEAEPEAAPAARAPAARPAPPPPPHPSTGEGEGDDFTDKSLSLMRKTIARRLLEAKQTIPHFYVTGDVDAAKLVAFRADLNAILGEEHKVSINDVIVK